MKKLIIANLYPGLMNLNGDRGNLICLKNRIIGYGYGCEILQVRLGDNIHFREIDMFIMGSGLEREQKRVRDDLLNKAEDLKEGIENGLPGLFIGSAYQLLGKYIKTDDGVTEPGLGLLDFYTEMGSERLSGNILVEMELEGEKHNVVGFENHRGRTWLDNDRLQPLGRVIKGFGNNGQDGSEGIKYHNLIGTYLHGPLLPKNPHIADNFIAVMTARKGLQQRKQLDDELEWLAHEQAKKKILATR